VSLCWEFAKELGCPNVRFEVGWAEALPFDDGSFDAVASFDVLEHVRDPALALREIRRVLRPCGWAWLVFPTYRGARASHLDFITRVPALHRVFDPDTIVAVVNAELRDSSGRYGVRSLDPPTISTLGYVTLPSLNGLTRGDAIRVIDEAGLCLLKEYVTPFVRPTDPVPGAGSMHKALAFWQSRWSLPELLIGSLAYELWSRPAPT
jgi:SAM-dependent methyltransferase